MTREEAIKVLEMFLHKQCDLDRTKFAYDQNTVWEAVNMASKALEQEPCEDAIPREKIKLLVEEHRKFREGITDEKVLIGFNMAIAICNKYLGESEDKE